MGNDNAIMVQVFIALSTLIGLVVSLAKIKAAFKRELEEETTKAVERAKEAASHDVELLKGQISSVSREIEQLDSSFQKEISFIKATYNSEIRNLGAKIEDLREEIKTSHSSLISLLTKLIEKQ